MKTGVFFSRCGGAFKDILDIDALAGQQKTASAVKVFDNFFGEGEFSALLDEVTKNSLDSVVLAGDSHYSYKQTRNGEYLFKCLENLGVNQNKVEVVNLKNMVALPHKADPRPLVQEKAQLMIDLALEKIRCSHDISMVEVAPRKSVALVGATAPSFVAAQHLLDEGYKVFLINDKPEINLPEAESKHIHPTIVYVSRHPRITIFNNTTPQDFYGYPGDFILSVQSQERQWDLFVGAVVLAPHSNSTMNKLLQSVFHLDINKDGSLAALDETTARSMTQDRGVFVINPPKSENGDMSQSFTAADATASLAINLLNRKEIYHSVKVSEVREELCSGCGACVKTCMFRAVSLFGNPPISHIDPRRCRGCGNCVTACPADARDLVNSPNRALFSAIEILSRFGKSSGRPRVLAIACEGCGYRCMNNAAEEGSAWPVGVLPLQVVCGGQIDMRLVMHAFVKGFDGVALTICGEGCCHNIIGNVDLERRANLFRVIMESRGLDSERMTVISTCSRRGKECLESVNAFYSRFAGAVDAASTIVLG